VLFFLGVVAFVRLPINLDPDVSFRWSTSTSPTRRRAHGDGNSDRQKVEGSISSIGNVRNITTFIVEGQVNILYRVLDRHADRPCRDGRRDAVAKVRNDLPQGIIEPLVTRVNVDGGALRLLRGDDHQSDARTAQLVSSTTL